MLWAVVPGGLTLYFYTSCWLCDSGGAFGESGGLEEEAVWVG